MSHESIAHTVVKLGGGVLEYPDHFDRALMAIGALARANRLLVVPGGGPFADTVREVDRRLTLSDDAAHWMAVLAMDQYAQLVASKLVGGRIVAAPGEIAAALERGYVPVLAPSRWLQEVDPLPHTWDVTSDSIAAWVSGEVGARSLVLIKPPRRLPGRTCATGFGPASPGVVDGELVDAHFARVLPAHVAPVVITADDVESLESYILQTSTPE